MSVVDDAVDFISAILGFFGLLICIGFLFVNISGMLLMVPIQAISQFVFHYKIPYWFMWIASIILSFQVWYATERLIQNHFPATPDSEGRSRLDALSFDFKEDCNQKAMSWFNGGNLLIGIFYLLDMFLLKTGIGSYCTKCFFGFFH
jgi:p-aminobenzoyl-glutamate transporter AbgT